MLLFLGTSLTFVLEIARFPFSTETDASFGVSLFYMPGKIIDNSNTSEPVVIKKNESVCIPMSKDGVFSNLDAKPEVMKIEQIGQYMDKPPSYSEAAMNMPPNYQDALDDISVIEGMLIGKSSFKVNLFIYAFVDDIEVGSGGIFLAHLLGSVLFHVVGIILGLLLSRSYAGRYGTMAGAGILLILYSLTIEDNASISRDLRSSLAVSLFIVGYMLFMFSLFMYQRILERAKEVFRNNYI